MALKAILRSCSSCLPLWLFSSSPFPFLFVLYVPHNKNFDFKLTSEAKIQPVCTGREDMPVAFDFSHQGHALVYVQFLCSDWSKLTWDQALFSFCFENYIPAGKAKRKESLIQTFYETSAAHFLDWLAFAESANQNYFVACFSEYANFSKNSF